jgi:hypothetical protein
MKGTPYEDGHYATGKTTDPGYHACAEGKLTTTFVQLGSMVAAICALSDLDPNR